jgi:hypothetical protein
MMLDIITISSRPNDTVADFFFGSGTSGEAAGMLGRSFIGGEKGGHWFDKGRRRIAAAFKDWDGAMTVRDMGDFIRTPAEKATGQMSLLLEAI